MTHKSKNNSSSEYSFSNSDTSSSSNSSSGRVPFFERTFASAIKLCICSAISAKAPTSKSMPFSNLAALGASQRREALSRSTKEDRKLPNSTSAASGLDRLIAREHEDLQGMSMFTIYEIQEATNRRPDRWPHHDQEFGPMSPSASGLEDLMGDLMAEMEKKAERTSEEYQKKSRPPVVDKIRVAETTPRGPVRVGSRQHYDAETPRPYTDDTPKHHARQASDPSSHSPTPSSPGIHSGKICQRCMEAPIRHIKNPKTDESRFCSACYAELYLPKCRNAQSPSSVVPSLIGSRAKQIVIDSVFETLPSTSGNDMLQSGLWRGIEGPCVSLFLDSAQTGSVCRTIRLHPTRLATVHVAIVPS
ncbi:hypothetical protein H4Q26_006942 [Puccinia striiformis f. sp. tritici PST-130]|nr:hypothetical protein H4Q26_006942 [Puccinia striiformis f. sp. tritici PST-130]